MKPTILWISGILLLLAAPFSYAHTQLGLETGLIAGFSHPFLGLDHLLAMLLVGVLAFIMGKKAYLTLPLSFIAMMFAGILLASSGNYLPAVETVIALSVIMLGVLVATEYKLTMFFTLFSVALFGLFHGYAHGSEIVLNTQQVAWYVGGILAATTLLHAVGILTGLLLRKRFTIMMRFAALSATGTGVWMLVS
jgi:urease accessory protein